MKKQYRFTLYTQDAIAYNSGTDNRRRQFDWRLNLGSIVENNGNVKMAIESIHCRDRSVIIDPALDYQANENNGDDLVGGGDEDIKQRMAIMNAVMTGNTDEKELYSIRCNKVMSKYFYDSRPSLYGYTPLIYNGPLKFQNGNPEFAFCYEVNPDIVNSDFTLYIDDNYFNQSGIKDDLQIAISFILFIE
jgi:hypothetical protein